MTRNDERCREVLAHCSQKNQVTLYLAKCNHENNASSGRLNFEFYPRHRPKLQSLLWRICGRRRMRLALCVWTLCAGDSSLAQRLSERTKRTEPKSGRKNFWQAGWSSFRSDPHRCPSTFHTGRLDNRLAKTDSSNASFRQASLKLPVALGWELNRVSSECRKSREHESCRANFPDTNGDSCYR